MVAAVYQAHPETNALAGGQREQREPFGAAQPDQTPIFINLRSVGDGLEPQSHSPTACKWEQLQPRAVPM